MPFQNGSNKVAIELRVAQFWSKIILVNSNRTSAQREFDFEITRMISDQIAVTIMNCTPFGPITYILLRRAGGKHESRILAGYYVFNANISLTFQEIKNLSAHSTYLCFGPVRKFFGEF